MGKVAKILLDAIERCDCELERVDAMLQVPSFPNSDKNLEDEKNNLLTCKKYLENALK